MTTLQPLTPLQILPPEQPNTIIEAVNIGATVPGTGNFTALSTNGAALTSLYAPISFSQFNEILVSSVTLTTAQVQGQTYLNNTGGQTFTLPTPSTGYGLVHFTFQGSNSVNSGTAAFILPDGVTSTGYTLNFAAYTSVSFIYQNGSGKWQLISQTGSPIITNATASNQAVALGQITGTASLAANFTSMTSTGVTSASNIVAGQTVTITQPVSGTVYRNINNFPIDIYAPITYSPTGSAAATCAVALDSSATPATLYTNSEPLGLTSGSVMTDHLTVPPKWYYSYTVANATIGTVNARAGAR